jgi:hypothetical protein
MSGIFSMYLPVTVLLSGVAFAQALLPPVISKSFFPTQILVGGETSLSFTIFNPNTTDTLTGVAFTDTFPVGVTGATIGSFGFSPTTCGIPPGTFTSSDTGFSASGLTIPAGATCSFGLDGLTGTIEGIYTNITSAVTSTNGGAGNSATAPITVGAVFGIHYSSNLNIGDSFVNLTNSGVTVANGTSQNLCANLYTFDPEEELISCCTCSVTPNALQSLSVQQSLISKPLTPAIPTSVVIKVVTTVDATCNAATATTLAPGLLAWGTSLHQNTSTAAVSYSVTETAFSQASLSLAEFTHLTSTCGFIQSNGSGFGICKGCNAGGLGAGTSVR